MEKLTKNMVHVARHELPITLDEAHNALAEACRLDITLFGKFVFGYDAADHHIHWLGEFFTQDTNKLMIISPRESAKTTWMCNILMTWFIGHFPEKTSVILSVTENQAIDRLIVIRDTIASNPRYKMVFPWIAIDEKKRMTTTEFSVWDMRKGSYQAWRSWEGRNKDSIKESTLEAAGAKSGQIIGNRYTGIVLLDDIHDEKNTNTREQINTIDTWFHRTVLPCLRPQAKALIIGTRWAPEDLLGRLQEKKKTIYENGIEIESNVPEWKVIQTQALTYDDEGLPVSYWPENWPVDRLLAKRDEVTPIIFELMYNNNPYALAGDIFKPEWLENPLPRIMPKFRWVDIAIDPAFTKKTRSDNTAMGIIGITDDFKVYNLGMRIGKFDKPEMIHHLTLLYTEAIREYHHVDSVFIEQVGAQVFLINDLQSETNFPIVGIPVANQGDKIARAQPFSMVCANMNYYCDFTTREGRIHKAELLAFPSNPKDDTVDMVSLAVRKRIGANGIIRAKTHKIRPKFML